MSTAANYAEWHERAKSSAELKNANEWRADPESPVYDASLLREHTEELSNARDAENSQELIPLLQEALYRHLGELADPRLYEVTPLGTKYVVEEFYREALECIAYLSDPEATGLGVAYTLAGFRRASHIFGRSALMLSGGGTLGFFHLGVVKVLLEQGLLPRVFSGSSMGAIVACAIGVRTDEELLDLVTNPRQIRTDAIKPLPPDQVVPGVALYDSKRLEKIIAHTCGDYTFGEAQARTGRIVNVSVSPTRERQKPRVLCHYTTPNVLMNSAAIASAAIPGVFAAATLQQRVPNGGVEPYHPTEQWVDGTMKGDLPMRRISRLHNVNHFIVSQVNPHVAPMSRIKAGRGLVPAAASVTFSGLRRQVVRQLELARGLSKETPFYNSLDRAHALAEQAYSGDINILPRIRAGALLRTLANISYEELEQHVLEGERSTWPLIARIRDQTCVSRALDDSIRRLKNKR